MKPSTDGNPPYEPRAQATGSPYPRGGGIELPILTDPGLAAQGWQRRHMVDATRAAESVELYESLGFEVRIEKVDRAQFGSQCAPCAPGDYVVIYTRKKSPD